MEGNRKEKRFSTEDEPSASSGALYRGWGLEDYFKYPKKRLSHYPVVSRGSDRTHL